MKKCISLAKKGTGKVSPNPLVGCVVLDKDENIISTGWHKGYGKSHAERDALLKVSKDICKGGTLIVNLEPCSHFGKTPPCADLIIEYGIKKVIIGMKDVNPIVSGNGIRKLKQADISVECGVLDYECKKLNEIFIKNMTKKTPFIAIKTASTLDGKISTYNGDSKWITSEKSRLKAKGFRKLYDAILTSSATVIADNPEMHHKNKIILDRELKTDYVNSKIYNDGEIYIYYDKNIPYQKAEELKKLSGKSNLHFIGAPAADNKISLEFVIKNAYDNGIMSIFIEAGGKLCGEFLPFADKIYQFISPKILGDNSGKSCYDYRIINNISDTNNFKIDKIIKSDTDILLELSAEI